jgi:hypothetical protein
MSGIREAVRLKAEREALERSLRRLRWAGRLERGLEIGGAVLVVLCLGALAAYLICGATGCMTDLHRLTN